MSHPLQAFFGQIRLFSALDADELNDILRAVQPTALTPGQRLFRQGDPGDAAYVVEAGSLEVFAETPDGEVFITLMERGDVIGELALLDGAPRSASARAREATRLFRLDRGEFDFLRSNLRPAAFQIIRTISQTLCERIRDTNDHIGRMVVGDEPLPEHEPPPNAAEALGTSPSGFFRRLLFRGGNR